MSLKNIDKKIATFTTNRKKLAELGQEICLMIFDHAFEHGDCTRALTLAQAMPKSWKVQLRDWFAMCTPIVVVEPNARVGFNPKYLAEVKADRNAAIAKWWKRDDGVATPFYDMVEPDPEVKELDLAAMLKLVQALSKRIEKKVEEGSVKPEYVEDGKELARILSGINIVHKERSLERDAAAANDKDVPPIAAVA